MPITTKKKGFTLIEVLIVVAIIGILAVLLIPSAITAIQKAKQKSTMRDILSMSTAATDYLTDKGNWDISQSGDIDAGSDFVQVITPLYIKICPVVDHWAEPYKVYVGSDAAVRSIADENVGPEDFVIESYGRDRIADGWIYDPNNTEDDLYTVDSWAALRLDIISWNGNFIHAPRVAVPSNN